MKLLDKITKWFFNTTKIEINQDWRLVALDLNRELIEAREENQVLYQRIADLEKLLGVYHDRTKHRRTTIRSRSDIHHLIYNDGTHC